MFIVCSHFYQNNVFHQHESNTFEFLIINRFGVMDKEKKKTVHSLQYASLRLQTHSKMKTKIISKNCMPQMKTNQEARTVFVFPFIRFYCHTTPHHFQFNGNLKSEQK